MVRLAGYAGSVVTYNEGGELTMWALVSNGEELIESVDLYYDGTYVSSFTKAFSDIELCEYLAGDLYYASFSIPPGVQPGEYAFSLMAQDYNGLESPVWPYLNAD